MDQSPSSRFKALKAKLGMQIGPIPNELDLVSIAIPFIRAAEKLHDTQTIHYILDYWIEKQASVPCDWSSSPPKLTSTYCYSCGRGYDYGGKRLISNCDHCTGSPLALHFLLDFLTHRTHIPYEWWEFLFARYLDKREDNEFFIQRICVRSET